jgi:poly(3-hydroxybutyrate) depolymerase
MQWAMQEYNLGEFYATGFSMGGALAFQLEVVMPTFFKGAILVNPALNITEFPASMADTVKKLNMGIIIGTEDPNYDAIISLANDIDNKGGKIKVIEKQGIGHVDQDYLVSQEFYDDWKELFDFINGTSTVEEYFEEDEIIISDNTLYFSGKGNSDAKIFSIEGLPVKEVVTAGNITINLSNLSSGIYIALIENEGRIVRKKFHVVK